MGATFYHGGKAGLAKGQYILPPTITRAKSMAAYGNKDCDTSKVYVTTDYAAAAMYAAGVDGDIYEVMPDGPLESDPDCTQPGLSYACSRARITKRHKLSDADKMRILSVLLTD